MEYPYVQNAYLWRNRPVYASAEDFNKDRYMIDGSKLIYKMNVDCDNNYNQNTICNNNIIFVCQNGDWIKQN